MDDLDAAGGLVLVLADLVGGEEAGVDEFAEDLGAAARAGVKPAPTTRFPVILSEGVRRPSRRIPNGFGGRSSFSSP